MVLKKNFKNFRKISLKYFYKTKFKNKIFTKNKKSQYFSYEAILGAFLFSIIIFNFTLSQNDINNNFLPVNSYMDTLTQNNNFRFMVETENLDNKTLTNNWDSILSEIKSKFSNFQLIISNSTSRKIIQNFSKNCKNIIYTEKIINIYNNTIQNFRIVKLGVCS